MKSNIEQLNIAKKHLGESCPGCCHMSNNCCCYFVSKIFKEAGNSLLFYGGEIVNYCPNAIKWCKTQLAQIPLFLAMPSDIIFFDWNGNNVPDHIGFVDHRISDQEIHTLEGNTTRRFVVAYQTRPAKYVLGIFRPHFKASYDISKPLVIDGQFDYQSVAMLQKALGIKVDGILGRDTIKSLQRLVGVTQDGSWGKKTSEAVQKFLKKEGVYKGEIDGCVYLETVKALQRWINAKVGKTTTTTDKTPTAKPQSPTEPSDGKLLVNGYMDKKSVERMQQFFGTTKDGIISGQKASLWKDRYPSFLKSVLDFSGKGSECVKKLQKWLGVKQDGILGEATVKAWQKKLGVTVDGCFGTKSCEAWQKYLNEHDKAVYPTVKESVAEKICDAMTKYAWASGTPSKTWLYPTGHARESYKDALKRYMGKSKKIDQSDCGYLPSTILRELGYKDALILKGNKDAFPAPPKGFEVVHRGKVPDGYLKRGDIVRYKKKSGSQHTYTVMDKNYIAEAGRKVRFPVIRRMKANSKCNAKGVRHNTIQVIRTK